MSLQAAPKIVLRRVINGWIVSEKESALFDEDILKCYCFESTKTLATKLMSLIGESKWRVTATLPKRDKKGHFLKKGRPVS